MVRRGAARTELALAFASVLATACGGGKAKPDTPVGVTAGENGAAVPTLARRPAVAFAFDSLDERPVSSDALRGKPTVLAFVTTWDLTSQAEVDFLVNMAKNDERRVNYALVALEEPRDRELVEVYAQKLGVAFPVALGDKETIAGRGPFGDVHNVPTVVILDREGRVAWQKAGLAKSDELRAALRGL